MAIGQVVVALNMAGILAVGSIAFFIIYTTFQGLEDQKIKEFSRRFLMVTAVLILNASYLMFYNAFLSNPAGIIGLLPFYLLLAITFILLIYSAMAFEDIANSYGISQETKLDKMDKEKMG